MSENNESQNNKLTHRCKFDTQSDLPLCPLAYQLCHSPCDLNRATNDTGSSLAITIEAPDGLYREGEIR